MPLDINSFMQPGYAPDVTAGEISNPTEPPTGMSPARPTVPTYTVQPVVWLFVTLAAAIIGLYFFLGEQ